MAAATNRTAITMTRLTSLELSLPKKNMYPKNAIAIDVSTYARYLPATCGSMVITP